MRLPSWLRPFAMHLNPVRKRRTRSRRAFRPRLESLEDRITPSVVQLTDPSIHFVSGPTNLTSVGSTLYFVADDGTHGTELWRTAGRPGDEVRVQGGQLNFDQVTAAAGLEQVPEEAQVGRWLYYFTDNGDSTYTLWRNDSTASPTDGVSPSEAIVTIPDPINNDDGPYQLKAVGSDLYFGTWSVADSAWELWKVTGADAPSGANLTAAKVQSSGPDLIDSNGPTNIWAAGSKVYLTADTPDPDATGQVLWVSDGTPDGTAPVQDAGGDYVSPLFYGTAAVGTDLYTIDTNHTLYRVSGQEATPIASVGDPISTINTISDFIEPTYFMTVAGDSVYFLANDHDPSRSSFQYDLWKINGSTASEVWQSPADDPGTPFRAKLSPLEMTAVGSDVYFADLAVGVGSDLWKSDGTPEGTELMKSFQAGVDQFVHTSGMPIGLTPVGSTLYFEGPDARFWQSGGTPETTYTTGDFLPGPVDFPSVDNVFGQDRHSPNYPGAISPFAAVGSTLYISPEAYYGGIGQLWRLNTAPVAADFNATVNEDSSNSLNLLAQVTDTDTVDLPYLSASVVSGPSHGTLTPNADGSFTYTPNAGYVGPDSFTYQASDGFDPSNTATVSLTVQSLQDAVDGLSTGGELTVQASSSITTSTVIDAINGLTNVAQPVTVIYDLGGGTYSATNVSAAPPSNVALVIQNGTLTGSPNGFTIAGGNVTLKNVTLDPDVPALTVTGGQVSVLNSTLTTTGDAPTLLVTGGSVTLANDAVIQTSTVYTDPAIALTGGTVNLGTATTPGNNTLSVSNSGNLVSNTSGNPISAVGDAFTVNGTVLAPDSLSGIVFQDFNDDGQVDFGEQGIAGVAVALTGTDFLGNAVNMSATTDSDGAYIFANLQPGTYAITETQPVGYNQGINTVGTAGGSLTATDKFFVSLAQDASGLNGLNYNFGEQPQATGSVGKGQTAGIGFWNNKNGQALIKSFNGGATSTQLAAWLADTLPHIFGVDAGSNALIHADGSYFTNAEVAARFQQDFVLKGVKLDAQVLATALSVYATNSTLDNTGVAANYGFVVSGNGVGTAGVNVGSNGTAFGVANNTVMTVLDLLKATDALAVDGLLYNGDALKRNEANSVYSAINDAGNIS